MGAFDDASGVFSGGNLFKGLGVTKGYSGTSRGGSGQGNMIDPAGLNNKIPDTLGLNGFRLVNPNGFSALPAEGMVDPLAGWGGGSSSDRDKQQALYDALLKQSQGQGVSLAQQQFQNALDQGLRAQGGAMASAKGINPALAARLAGQQGGQMTAQAAGQSALQRMQEQLAAQQMLGGLTETMRGQDIQNDIGRAGAANNYNQTLAGQNVGLGNINANVNQANVNAQNSMTQKILGQTIGAGGSLLSSMFSGGGEVTDTLSDVFSPKDDEDEEKKKSGGMSILPLLALLARGGYIAGANADSTTDSPKNDTVPILASPGEIVIPKSIANSSEPGERAKEFVEHIKSGGYKKVVEARKKKGSDE